MNIFATDHDPYIAARNLCDKHINKMIVESAQMLANAFTLDRLAEADRPRAKSGAQRTNGYKHHPCAKWARQSTENFRWLARHAYGMIVERAYRWPDNPSHFTESFIDWCNLNEFDTIPADEGVIDQTDFAIAISQDMSCRAIDGFDNMSSIDKYRAYYSMDKPFADWTYREPPKWFKKMSK